MGSQYSCFLTVFVCFCLTGSGFTSAHRLHLVGTWAHRQTLAGTTSLCSTRLPCTAGALMGVPSENQRPLSHILNPVLRLEPFSIIRWLLRINPDQALVVGYRKASKSRYHLISSTIFRYFFVDLEVCFRCPDKEDGHNYALKCILSGSCLHVDVLESTPSCSGECGFCFHLWSLRDSVMCWLSIWKSVPLLDITP